MVGVAQLFAEFPAHSVCRLVVSHTSIDRTACSLLASSAVIVGAFTIFILFVFDINKSINVDVHHDVIF